MEPLKHHPDYAKFELTDPPLVLSLEPGRANSSNRLNHLGIKVPNGDALRQFAEKAHTSGLAPQYIQSVECCYSRQTKLCLTDPDENLVEFYIVEADLEKNTLSSAPKAENTTAPAGPVAWDHLLGTPFPKEIPLVKGSVDEVRLRGSFNLKKTKEEGLAILSEVNRVLRPKGEIMLHLLVSDKEVTKKLPRLPGPAALVEHRPTEFEVIELLEDAGFSAISIQRLSHSAVFQFDGAQMRELMVTASPELPKPSDKGSFSVVYKGPYWSITDDSGTTFRRGLRTVVTGTVFANLNNSKLSEDFVFLNKSPASACTVTESETRESTLDASA